MLNNIIHWSIKNRLVVVIAAMRTCGPQLVRSSPSRLDGWLASDASTGARGEVTTTSSVSDGSHVDF